MQLEAVGHPVAVVAAAVQGLGLAAEPMPELAVEPEPGPVVQPVGPAWLAEIVPGHPVGHLLIELGLPLQVVPPPLQAAWLQLQLQVLSLVAS